MGVWRCFWYLFGVALCFGVVLCCWRGSWHYFCSWYFFGRGTIVCLAWSDLFEFPDTFQITSFCVVLFFGVVPPRTTKKHHDHQGPPRTTNDHPEPPRTNYHHHQEPSQTINKHQ